MSARAWALLLVLSGTIFLEGIDVAMLSVAIPSIRSDLELPTGTAAWVMSAYVLGYAGFTLLGGRAADLLGRRRMFLTWLAVFVGFSGLGGFATEGWMLIVARFVTGVAAAFMTPAALSIITTSYAEGPQRNKALLVFAGTAAGGFSLGLVIGGVLTEFGWRWVFFAPVVLAGAILVAAVRIVPAERAARTVRTVRTKKGFDLPGAAVAAGAMLLLAYGIVRLEHGTQGWQLTLAAVLAGLLLIAAFVAVERRTEAPLVRLGIFRTGSVVRAGLGAMLFVGAFFGFQFVATLYLQELRGWSSLQTAFALFVLGIDAVLAPTLTPRLVAGYGNTRVILGGFLAAILAYGTFLQIGLEWSYAAMFPVFVLVGTGFALAYGPLTIAATDGVAEEEQGLAGGLLNTATQFGSAVGISAVTAVYGLALPAGDPGPGETLDAFRTALGVPLAMAVLGAVVTALGLRNRRTKVTKVVAGAVADEVRQPVRG
ncbi:MFS transporter [Streptomyces beijiangensis]|uniref:MFS transporter n=2 Tax=Streptomyces beijiangensis TaxID=163361 RepID=A0A939F6Q7_9ACTN|nr:MFS transporter [Streptomyces beijiangensis]MBO0513082.1 MFS transporter [Streptomyces beijiangensis]